MADSAYMDRLYIVGGMIMARWLRQCGVLAGFIFLGIGVAITSAGVVIAYPAGSFIGCILIAFGSWLLSMVL
jgi:hypothetical protein